MSRDIIGLLMIGIIAVMSLLVLNIDGKEIVLAATSGIIGYLSKKDRND